ncbi:MAG TPA: sugar phosphate nucleotidyltransferase [Candidatus Sabulitectum sp.]|nr:sugar phosphate nucleotidyltransferase [Candidatus Sabulitectum sp.]HPJ28165.1 sugar phosphate nucleotidyltransferase [Candidatus Sabulitectum sp.]HPR21831.1 sugar phosphate nucleotidyltransferase [Candidatus Sabulitectum sp.]
MKSSELFPVIMAGGRGTRFWPASVKRRPKQFMDLLGGGTMIQLTAARFMGLAEQNNVMVVTGAEHGETVLEQMPWIARENLLLEPAGRNTAPCIGWAAETLRRRGLGHCIMIIAASDHMISPVQGFRNTLEKAVKLAEEGCLCTIGIPPDHPATGYGYIRRGKAKEPGWTIRSFTEKPDLQTAADYLRSGEYLWNSGMFVWKADAFLHELEKHMPGLYRDLVKLPDTTAPSLEVYGALDAISVDYGVMEKTSLGVMVEAEFSWSDIGDWPGARKAGVKRGESMLIDSDDVLVYDETGRLTVVVGLKGASVVSTDRVTLVMADSDSQSIRDVVKELEESRPELV